MKKRYTIIIVAILVLLTAVNAVIFLISKSHSDKKSYAEEEAKCYMQQTLDLSNKQAKEYDKLRTGHQAVASLIVDSLIMAQESLSDYVQSHSYNADSILKYEYRVGHFQQLLLRQSILQYYDIKDILDKEQIPALDSIYKHLLTCEEPSDFKVQHSDIHVNINNNNKK
ncbi:MAG: hypothetical protein LBL74_00215 [Bacteroidales bacterium]|jgi:hypothetical protein|nr:hypothetical protein [Bacteroidales bacterium]